MDITTVEQIFQQASALGVKEIIPSTMGEPLLYKGIERIFELANAHNIKINLTTNGTFPRKTIDEWARIIVPNTTDIKISWNGATKGTSEAVMKGLNFEKVLENTKSLIELRNEHFTQTGYFCRITLQLTFMRSNMHELSDIIKLAASLGIDRVKGHHLWAHFQEIQGESMKHSKVSIADWNRYVADAVSVSETNLKPNGEKVILENILPINENEIDLVPFDYECPFLGKELWISATGKISPCCAPDKLRASLGDFGNIDTQSISELLSSDIYQNLVLGYKDNELCKTCNMRKPK
jgi:MoaA/NifB/PqqE/SkfB family radical SAM enzyme